MKLSEKVAELENKIPKKTNKLFDHDKTEYFVCKLPKINNEFNNFSLEHNIQLLIQRYAKLYGLKASYSQRAFGKEGTKNHYIRMITKVYSDD